MKKGFIALIILALMLVMSFGSVATVYGAEKDYNFKVTLYSGEQGVFTKAAAGGTLSNGGKVWTGTFKKNDNFAVSTKDLGLKITDKKYYCRGFRIAGHDNDETTGAMDLNFNVGKTGDISYTLAYGIKGGLVSYVVNYVDESGNKLMSSVTYYGMKGDKPVVSYRYIEGYTPQAYTLGKTLSDNESKNVFNFVYTAYAGSAGAEGTAGSGTGNGTGNGGNGANAAGAGAAAPGTVGNPDCGNLNLPDCKKQKIQRKLTDKRESRVSTHEERPHLTGCGFYI